LQTGKRAIAAALLFALGAAVRVMAQTSVPKGGPQAAPASAPTPSELQPGKGFFLYFPQQTRHLAPPGVIARGKAVFEVNCGACHGADLRGGDQGGPNLLHSEVALSDQHGELILPIVRGARQNKGMPAFSLSDTDVIAVAEYIHSILARVGVQGRPPGAYEIPVLQVIVGDPVAGKTYFEATCAACHSTMGDLKGIASKYPEPRTLQNIWVAGGLGGGLFPGVAAPKPDARATPVKPTTVAVTLANGQKLDGVLVQKNDFIVTLIEEDGTRRSITRNSDVTSVELQDPHEAHRKLALALDDKDMHDVTAYLATIK
jgi:cytochrome c oxidase cbb3-type subunit 3